MQKTGKSRPTCRNPFLLIHPDLSQQQPSPVLLQGVLTIDHERHHQLSRLSLNLIYLHTVLLFSLGFLLELTIVNHYIINLNHE